LTQIIKGTTGTAIAIDGLGIVQETSGKAGENRSAFDYIGKYGLFKDNILLLLSLGQTKRNKEIPGWFCAPSAGARFNKREEQIFLSH
jgi:hypothetical protein